MTDEFGHRLLAVIEERAQSNKKQDIVFMTTLASVVRQALGLKDPESFAVQPIPPQTYVRPEFPHLHVRYAEAYGSGNELDRKLCNSLTEHGEIHHFPLKGKHLEHYTPPRSRRDPTTWTASAICIAEQPDGSTAATADCPTSADWFAARESTARFGASGSTNSQRPCAAIHAKGR